MNSATKPVEQKAREMELDVAFNSIDAARQVLRAANQWCTAADLHDASNILRAALNTDGERIRREAFEEAAKVALFHARDSRNGRAVRAECLAVHQDILSTPSKGVG